jgi:N-methylhydantoinase A
MSRSFIAVDTGGTFTDLVVFDPDTQRVRFTKSLTTHHAPREGIFDCLRKTQVALHGAAQFKLGTTLVINTLIERTGPAVALVSTRNFRDVLELARGNRLEPFDLFYRRQSALVPRQARLEVDERTAGDGSILVEPKRDEVEALAVQLRALKVEGVAVSFINSYLQPGNERKVTVWLRELLPGVFVTCGSELSREWYEYERTSTAAANAYCGPRISEYVRALDASLKESGFDGRFLLMGSNGGVLSARRAAEAPVMLVESGPIGGCLGASIYAKAIGIDDLIAFDMGGTTAKAAIVSAGSYDVVSTYYVGGYGQGIPIRTPVVDIVEVGAGGGSIAWVDEQARLHVGPRSAGSQPGPVAYGRGGLEPTVTDANLILGRLNPASFQGGEMQLNRDAARKALTTRLAKPLGYSGEAGMLEVANGVLAIAAVTMSGAIKRITVERGRDPRDFALFAYGGGGPLHGVELARELGIPLVIIPPEPGNFAAVGMLLSDIRRDDGRTFLRPLEVSTIEQVEALYREMEQELRVSLCADFGNPEIQTECHLEMRYVGQMHTVRVPFTGTGEGALQKLRERFDDEYAGRFGHLIKGAGVEIVSVHTAAVAQLPRPTLEQLFSGQTRQAPADPPSREVCFSGMSKTIAARVWQRVDLPVGFTADGPAVIEEYGSTTIVGPYDRFAVGRLGELHIHVSPRKTGGNNV